MKARSNQAGVQEGSGGFGETRGSQRQVRGQPQPNRYEAADAVAEESEGENSLYPSGKVRHQASLPSPVGPAPTFPPGEAPLFPQGTPFLLAPSHPL